MTAAAGKLYDPVLMQVFINTVGPHPPLSFTLLPDGRRARSVSLVRD